MIWELHQFGILTLIRCSVLLLYHNYIQVYTCCYSVHVCYYQEVKQCQDGPAPSTLLTSYGRDVFILTNTGLSCQGSEVWNVWGAWAVVVPDITSAAAAAAAFSVWDCWLHVILDYSGKRGRDEVPFWGLIEYMEHDLWLCRSWEKQQKTKVAHGVREFAELQFICFACCF